MEAITLPIYNTEGKEVDSVKLDSAVFNGVINNAAIHQAVCAYMANQRRGLAATKTRGEVSGGGRKPWRQKGTGRARVGSIRSPLWRHGGVIFGPHPRDYSYTIPNKIKIVALKSALCLKIKENNFIVVDKFQVGEPKTKEAIKIFSNLKLNPANSKAAKADKKNLAHTLLLLDKLDANLKLALRNIDFLDVNSAKDAHIYQILAHRKLVITKEALAELTGRLKIKK